MLSASIINAVQQALSTAGNVLVITHVSPDGDAISSLTAMGFILKQLGKQYTLVCDDGLPERFSFLPISNQIKSQPELDTEYQLIIALDAGDRERMGLAYADLSRPLPPIINIDHHGTNTLFGDIDIVIEHLVKGFDVIFGWKIFLCTSQNKTHHTTALPTHRKIRQF